MELNSQTKSALQQLGNDSKINDSIFKKLVTLSMDCILNDQTPTDSKTFNSKQSSVPEHKVEFTALLYLFFEASKHDYNSLELSTKIEDDIMNQNRIQFICESFEASKDSIRKKLETKGFEFPSLIDIDW
jgi:hypothetical protein